MKLDLLAVLFIAGTAVASPALNPRGILNPIFLGFPSDSVTCPVKDPSKGDSFSPRYMKEDIKESHPGPKAGYPRKFGTGAPGSGQFHFENDCLERAKKGESIWELPMKTGGVTWKDSNTQPGPYRVYYIVRDGKPGSVEVTYCGAYAHTSPTNQQIFDACT